MVFPDLKQETFCQLIVDLIEFEEGNDGKTLERLWKGRAKAGEGSSRCTSTRRTPLGALTIASTFGHFSPSFSFSSVPG